MPDERALFEPIRRLLSFLESPAREPSRSALLADVARTSTGWSWQVPARPWRAESVAHRFDIDDIHVVVVDKRGSVLKVGGTTFPYLRRRRWSRDMTVRFRDGSSVTLAYFEYFETVLTEHGFVRVPLASFPDKYAIAREGVRLRYEDIE